MFRSVLHKCCFFVFCLLPFTLCLLSFPFVFCPLPFPLCPLSFVCPVCLLPFTFTLCTFVFPLRLLLLPFVLCLSSFPFVFCFYLLPFVFSLSPLFFVFCLSPSSFTFYPLSFVVLLSPLSFAFYPLSFVFCLSPLSFASLFKEKRNASLSHTNESSLLQDTSFALKAPEIAKWKELFWWEHALAIAEPNKPAWQSNSKLFGPSISNRNFAIKLRVLVTNYFADFNEGGQAIP